MPTYSYYCPTCEHHEDKFHRSIARAVPPRCCGMPMRKTVTAAQGFKFTRGGFSASSETKDKA